MPGRRSMIAYRPCPSLTAVRTFSMSAGLVVSIVTPGITAPLVSLTRPVMLLWAETAPGSNRQSDAATAAFANSLRSMTSSVVYDEKREARIWKLMAELLALRSDAAPARQRAQR